jgi:hypothetical protein
MKTLAGWIRVRKHLGWQTFLPLELLSVAKMLASNLHHREFNLYARMPLGNIIMFHICIPFYV